VAGTGIELSFTNTAIGPLYVRGLQVRGTAIIAFDSQQIIVEDSTSITAYGRRSMTYAIPFESGEIFSEAVGQYLLGRYKDPQYIAVRETFANVETVGGTHVLSVELGDVLDITDSHSGITNELYLVWGIETIIASGGDSLSVTFTLRPLSDKTYWLLEDATYGKLGDTTRLAI